MFLFEKLYFAHLIADFILQFEELYQLKLKSKLGHLGHVVIHAIISYLIVIPYWGYPSIWFAVLLIVVIHYFQDNIKYALQAKYPRNTFWYFSIDQVVHVAVVALIFLFPAAQQIPGSTGSGTLHYLYYDPLPTRIGMLFVITTFGGSYFLHSIHKTFIKTASPLHLITSFEMTHALIERPLISAAFLFSDSPLCWISTLAVGLIRLPFAKLRNKLDFAMSFLFAAFWGWLFKAFLWA